MIKIFKKNKNQQTAELSYFYLANLVSNVLKSFFAIKKNYFLFIEITKSLQSVNDSFKKLSSFFYCKRFLVNNIFESNNYSYKLLEFTTQSKLLFKNSISFKLNQSYSFIKILFHSSSEKLLFDLHHGFNLYHIRRFKNGIIILDLNRFRKRWVEAESLLFSIFFYNYYPLFMGSLDIKNETNSLNWSNPNIEFDFFLKSFPFYIFKTPVFNSKVQHFYKKLELLEITFVMILNYAYHEKTLHFFKSTFFTIAPVNSVLSPWEVDYSIPVVSAGKHIQVYFIKILVFLEKNSLYVKHVNFKKSLADYFIKFKY